MTQLIDVNTRIRNRSALSHTPNTCKKLDSDIDVFLFSSLAKIDLHLIGMNATEVNIAWEEVDVLTQLSNELKNEENNQFVTTTKGTEKNVILESTIGKKQDLASDSDVKTCK